MMSIRTNNPHLQEFKTWKIVSQVFCCLHMDSILGVNPKWIVAALHTLVLFLDNSTLFYSIATSNKLFLLATSSLYNVFSLVLELSLHNTMNSPLGIAA